MVDRHLYWGSRTKTQADADLGPHWHGRYWDTDLVEVGERVAGAVWMETPIAAQRERSILVDCLVEGSLWYEIVNLACGHRLCLLVRNRPRRGQKAACWTCSEWKPLGDPVARRVKVPALCGICQTIVTGNTVFGFEPDPETIEAERWSVLLRHYEKFHPEMLRQRVE